MVAQAADEDQVGENARTSRNEEKRHPLDKITAEILWTVDQTRVGPKFLLFLAILGGASIYKWLEKQEISLLIVGIALLIVGIAPTLAALWVRRRARSSQSERL